MSITLFSGDRCDQGQRQFEKSHLFRTISTARSNEPQIDVSKPNRALRTITDPEPFGGFLAQDRGRIDNGTIIGWGDNSTAGGEFVIDLEDGRGVSSQAVSKILSEFDRHDRNWHHGCYLMRPLLTFFMSTPLEW